MGKNRKLIAMDKIYNDLQDLVAVHVRASVILVEGLKMISNISPSPEIQNIIQNTFSSANEAIDEAPSHPSEIKKGMIFQTRKDGETV